MPRPKKPPGQRQRTNTPEIGRLSVVQAADVVVPAAPRPPRAGGKPGSLLKVTEEAWGLFWTSSVAAIVDQASDLPALRRLFLLYDERERAMRHVAEAGRLTTGSTGQQTLDPLYKHMSVLDGQITALEDRFGLTPMARLKLGVTFGEAAKSLDAMNARLDGDDHGRDDDGEDDPRLGAITTTAG